MRSYQVNNVYIKNTYSAGLATQNVYCLRNDSCVSSIIGLQIAQVRFYGVAPTIPETLHVPILSASFQMVQTAKSVRFTLADVWLGDELFQFGISVDCTVAIPSWTGPNIFLRDLLKTFSQPFHYINKISKF